MSNRWESFDVSHSYSIVFRTASLRKMRLFAVAVARLVRSDLFDPVYRQVVETTERLADAVISEEERRQATADGHAFDRQLPMAFPGMRPVDAIHLAVAGWVQRHFMPELPVPDHAPDAEGIAGLRRIAPELFGDNPYRPGAFRPAWRTTTTVGMARSMYESRDFAAMPILADALEEAGCDEPSVLAHCRGDGPHVRGCWVVDLVLGKA